MSCRRRLHHPGPQPVNRAITRGIVHHQNFKVLIIAMAFDAGEASLSELEIVVSQHDDADARLLQ